jgi:hypothetical protein
MKNNIYRDINITRPANTTAYAANDVIGSSTAAGGGVITIPSTGGDHLLLTLISNEFRVDLAAVPSGMTSFRLHLYSASPPSAYADNDPWDLPAGDRTYYIGHLDLGTPADFGSTLYVHSNAIYQGLLLPPGGTMYGYLVTVGGYTPASGTTMFARFFAEGM